MNTAICFRIGLAFGLRELYTDPRRIELQMLFLVVSQSFVEQRFEVRLMRKALFDEMRKMLQQLLIDLQVESASTDKRRPVHALVLAKGQPKPHPSKERHRDATPRTPSRTAGTEPQSGQLIFKDESMPDFAWALSRTAGIGDRLVVDQTGLAGNYDFELTFGRDDAASSEPSVFSALQEQLGLKLEPKKAPVEFLVIGHVDKPSGN